jgi:hypothetical protein
MKMDDWFKPAILILAVIFLFIFGLHAFKGRYKPILDDCAVLDTFTGNVYKLSGERAFLDKLDSKGKPIDKFSPEKFDPPQNRPKQ